MQRILSRLDLATFDDPFDHPVKQSEKEGGHDSMGLPLHFIPVPGCYSPPSDDGVDYKIFLRRETLEGNHFSVLSPPPGLTGTNSCLPPLALTRPMSPEQACYFCTLLEGGKRGD